MIRTRAVRLILWLLAGSLPLAAQPRAFAGGSVGISTLSGDATSVISGGAARISQYKPENGPVFDGFAGAHLGDYLSVQGAVIWNRNRLGLLSAAGEAFYDQERTSRQIAGSIDGLLYFRNRASWVRPYLAIGLAVVHFSSEVEALRASTGSPPPPPSNSFSSTGPGLRAAAGIDLRLGGGWYLRYNFMETIQKTNPISAQLDPVGQRRLAHFQNMFGFVRYF